MNASVKPVNESLTERWLSRSGTIFTLTWLCLGGGTIAVGWWYRDEGYLSAGSGLGYWLGIVGGSAMLLLLTYSLRKRWRLLRRTLPIKWWFQLHMTLGIAGPLCILFHSNFHLGSLNSTVAMVCMLLVAGSGIIGRYIYNRIHFGLYGERIRLRQTLSDFQTLQRELATLAATEKQRIFCDKLFAAVEQMVTRQQQGSWLSLWRERRRARRLSAALHQFILQLDNHHARQQRPAQELEQVRRRIQQDYAVLEAILRRLPGLQLFERLFSLWHVIHIPIFVLMIITAIIHVVVVHMY